MLFVRNPPPQKGTKGIFQTYALTQEEVVKLPTVSPPPMDGLTLSELLPCFTLWSSGNSSAQSGPHVRDFLEEACQKWWKGRLIEGSCGQYPPTNIFSLVLYLI